MTSQNAQKSTIGIVQEYPIQPNQEGLPEKTDTQPEYDRLVAAQYVEHDYSRRRAGPGAINGLSHEPALSTMHGARTLSVAVDAVALITTECITVTSAMRKHARWAHSSVTAILGGGPSFSRTTEASNLPTNRGKAEHQNDAGNEGYGSGSGDNLLASRWGLRGKKGKSMQDDPLIAAFARLRNDLRGCTGTLEAARVYSGTD